MILEPILYLQQAPNLESHTLTIPSLLEETKSIPLGADSTDKTGSEWASKFITTLSWIGLNTFTDPSKAPIRIEFICLAVAILDK